MSSKIKFIALFLAMAFGFLSLTACSTDEIKEPETAVVNMEGLPLADIYGLSGEYKAIWDSVYGSGMLVRDEILGHHCVPYIALYDSYEEGGETTFIIRVVDIAFRAFFDTNIIAFKIPGNWVAAVTLKPLEDGEYECTNFLYSSLYDSALKAVKSLCGPLSDMAEKIVYFTAEMTPITPEPSEMIPLYFSYKNMIIQTVDDVELEQFCEMMDARAEAMYIIRSEEERASAGEAIKVFFKNEKPKDTEGMRLYFGEPYDITSAAIWSGYADISLDEHDDLMICHVPYNRGLLGFFEGATAYVWVLQKEDGSWEARWNGLPSG